MQSIIEKCLWSSAEWHFVGIDHTARICKECVFFNWTLEGGSLHKELLKLLDIVYFVSDFKYVTKDKENNTNEEVLANIMGKVSQKQFGLLRSAGIACFRNKLT